GPAERGCRRSTLEHDVHVSTRYRRGRRAFAAIVRRSTERHLDACHGNPGNAHGQFRDRELDLHLTSTEQLVYAHQELTEANSAFLITSISAQPQPPAASRSA